MNWKDRNELQKIIDELPEVMQLRIRNYIEHSQQQLLEGLSKKVKPVEEGEAMFKDDKDGLLSEGYTIGWNECVKQVKALIQEEKERL